MAGALRYKKEQLRMPGPISRDDLTYHAEFNDTKSSQFILRMLFPVLPKIKERDFI